MDETQGWKTRVLVIGALVGLVTGVGAAYVFIKQSEELPERPKLTTGDGMKVGMSLVTFLKMISELGNKA